MKRREFLKHALVSSAGILGVPGSVALIETNQLDVNPVELTLPRLPMAFDGFKLVQLSDIHMGTGMTEDKLLEIVGIVNAQAPDVVALTGDYLTEGPVDAVADALIRPLRQLAPVAVVVGVLGNHDHHAGAGQIRDVLTAAHIRELPNNVLILERDGALLTIAGLDDMLFRRARLDQVLDRLPQDGGSLLLIHEPDFADVSAQTGRFDLQLSGHSHGGQVVMPFKGPLALPFMGEKYHTGRYQVGTMIQYTNRGVGTTPPPIRINCPPEVTVFTLRAPQN